MLNPSTLINPTLAEEGILVTRPIHADQADILSPDALRFVAALARRFAHRRDELLKLRAIRQREIDNGHFPDFRSHTRAIRESAWQAPPASHDLSDCRVEIADPARREALAGALAADSTACVADFEDAFSPTWQNCVQAQAHLYDAARNANDGVLIVRPRGWHLNERHVRVSGERVPAALFDFGLYAFHNAGALLARGAAPHFDLPKLESHLEARLWNEIFVCAQEMLELPRGTVRATVPIETILAAFEMDEIVWELREHLAGLRFERWNYVFSFVKRFRNRAEFMLPDRAQLAMARPFLRACVRLLAHTCQRRGTCAVGVARLPARDEDPVSAADLLAAPEGTRSERGLRRNVRTGVRALEAWLRGEGRVALGGRTENIVTAEVARALAWQWIRHGAALADGGRATRARVARIIAEETRALEHAAEAKGLAENRFAVAGKLFAELTIGDEFPEFASALAYGLLE
jgi:malate synthase